MGPWWRRAAVVTAALTVGACIGEGTHRAGPPAGEDTAPGNGLIADRLPRVTHHGGRFLRSPRLHTVTFLDDDPTIVTALERFGEAIGMTEWWESAVGGYCAGTDDCVGRLRTGRPLRLDDRLDGQVTDATIEGSLHDAIDAGRLGPIDDNTLVVVYLPPDVEFGDARHPRYCGAGPRALHQTLRRPGTVVPYAVVPRCGDLDQVTISASHEILEATTNPEPANRGFGIAGDADGLPFTYGGAEPADPCRLLTTSPMWREAGFALHRVWSNQAAERGTDPCGPQFPERPYRALVPAAPAVRMTEPGEDATIVLQAASDRPVSPWSIMAVELSGREPRPGFVDLALDRSVVASGDAATLTVTLRRTRGREPIVIALLSTDGDQTDMWPVAVITRG